MRKISAIQSLVFLGLLALSLTSGIAASWLLLGSLPLGDFRGVTLVGAAVIFIYLSTFLVYRLFLYASPLTEGDIAEGSREEFILNVDTLFYVVMFYPIIRSYILPVPVMRLVYLALGARLGTNTYSGGSILDPPLTKVGSNTIIGHDAVLFSHAIEGRHLALGMIEIGDNVTIGSKAIIMSDVKIGSGAIVSAGALVRKGTRIGPGEIWGGVPARLIKQIQTTD